MSLVSQQQDRLHLLMGGVLKSFCKSMWVGRYCCGPVWKDSQACGAPCSLEKAFLSQVLCGSGEPSDSNGPYHDSENFSGDLSGQVADSIPHTAYPHIVSWHS